MTVFFGWWVTAALALIIFVSTGIRFSAGPFLKPVVADLGIDRAAFSAVISIGLLLYGAAMPVVGRLADRLGARAVMLAGTLVLGASMAATGFVSHLWQLYVVYALTAGAGLAATSVVVGSTVVSRWFVRHRGTALGVLSAATMAGMGLLMPVVTWLILATGWRSACVILGVATVVLVLPLVLVVVRESPESMALAVDGGGPAIPASGGRGERTPVSTAATTVAFWQLAAAIGCCGFSMGLLGAHGVPMLTDHGYHPMVASGALAVLGGTSAIFVVALGAISDRFGRRPVLAWVYLGRLVTFAALFLVQDSPALLMAFVAVGGLSMSGSIAMISALTADIFGRFSVGSIFGFMFLVHQVGAALGSWLGGALFELTGGYGAVFAVSCGLLLVAAVVSLAIQERSPVLAPAAGA